MGRRTAEELRAEIDRADALLRLIYEFRADYFSQETAESAYGFQLPEKEDWISRLRANGGTWSQILKGYEQAINDVMACFAMSDPDTEAFGAGLRAVFQERTGKDLFSVVTPPTQRLKAIAKRGSIVNKAEFYLVKEFTENVAGGPGFTELAEALETCLANYQPDNKD